MNRRPRWLAIAFGALTLASVDAHALGWAGLWSRPDQRAENLLEAGNAAAAAALFQDPRRKAYAEIEAHHYADAAQRLQPYADPLSSYNRGNALTRAGHLHQALVAYDAALKRAPPQSGLYRDARHNRDLVAKQLASHKPPSGKKGGAKSAKKGAGHGKSQPSQGQQAPGQGKQPPSQGQQAPSQNPQASGHPNSSPGQQGTGKQAPGKQAQSSAQQAASPVQSQAPQPQSQSPQGSPASAAPPSAAPPSAPPPTGTKSGAALAPQDLAGGRQSPPHPESERAMSLDQWLRWIPDDPGGLLRRKFMIEHMLHQGKSQR